MLNQVFFVGGFRMGTVSSEFQYVAGPSDGQR